MSTSGFHCLGRDHEARFSEDFDQVLADAFRAAPHPAEAADEIDDTTLLTVLANFAGAGPYLSLVATGAPCHADHYRERGPCRERCPGPAVHIRIIGQQRPLG